MSAATGRVKTTRAPSTYRRLPRRIAFLWSVDSSREPGNSVRTRAIRIARLPTAARHSAAAWKRSLFAFTPTVASSASLTRPFPSPTRRRDRVTRTA
jgi:hypothetical protein